MISAAEARNLTKHIWLIQLELLERAIKDAVVAGDTCVWYSTSMLESTTIEWLKLLGYRIEEEKYNITKISWED